MQGCRGGHTSLVLLLVAAAHALVDCFFLLVTYPLYHSSPYILCTTYTISIIDDVRENEKEDEQDTENEANDGILSGLQHFPWLLLVVVAPPSHCLLFVVVAPFPFAACCGGSLPLLVSCGGGLLPNGCCLWLLPPSFPYWLWL